MNSVDFEAPMLKHKPKTFLIARSFWHSGNGSKISGLYEM